MNIEPGFNDEPWKDQAKYNKTEKDYRKFIETEIK